MYYDNQSRFLTKSRNNQNDQSEQLCINIIIEAKCVQCDKFIEAGVRYYQVKGLMYHLDCYEKIFLCTFCDQSIDGSYVTDKNLVYHEKCYAKLNVCQNCKNSFVDGTSYHMHNGMKFCRICYQNYEERIKSAKNKYV